MKSSIIFFLYSTYFASIQRNTPHKCFHHTFLQVKAEGSSHEVSFLVESLFSQSSSPSYFMTTTAVFGLKTSDVTKSFHSFQILSTSALLLRQSAIDRQLRIGDRQTNHVMCIISVIIRTAPWRKAPSPEWRGLYNLSECLCIKLLYCHCIRSFLRYVGKYHL